MHTPNMTAEPLTQPGSDQRGQEISYMHDMLLTDVLRTQRGIYVIVPEQSLARAVHFI